MKEKIMSKKPTVLMILDGYGLNENKEANAVAEAKTPVTHRISGINKNHKRDPGWRFL